MKKKILEILLGSLKAKIITSTVAILLVGGVATAGIVYKNSIDQSTKKEVSLESNSEDTSKKVEKNVDEKEDETLDNSGKATEEKALTNESEDQKGTSSNEGGNNVNSVASSNNDQVSNNSDSNKNVNTNTGESNNSSDLGGQTNEPNTSNQPKPPVQQDKPKLQSEWLNSESQQALASTSRANTNNYDTNSPYITMTKEAFDKANAIMNSFVSGSIDSETAKSQIESIKFKIKENSPTFNFTEIYVQKVEVDGKATREVIVSNIRPMQYFMFCKAYYNGDINKTTIWWGTALN